MNADPNLPFVSPRLRRPQVFDTPEAAVARLLPEATLDLSAAAYDRWLAERKGALFARYGLDE